MAALLIVGAVGVLLLLASLLLGDVLDGIEFGGDLFSGSALAAFLGAFGFAGALAHGATDGNMGIAILVGIVAGALLGAGVGFATGRLRRGGDEANVRTADLVGRTGTVVSAVPDEGYGEVSLTVAGHITKLNARAGQALSAGTPVTVTAVLSATSVSVEPTAR